MADAHVHHSRHSLYLPGRFAPPLSKEIASHSLFSKTAHNFSPFPLSADCHVPYSFEKIKASQPELPRIASGGRRAHCRVHTGSRPFCHTSAPSPRLHSRRQALVFPPSRDLPSVMEPSFPCPIPLLQSNEGSPTEHPQCLGFPTLERRKEEREGGEEGRERRVSPSLPISHIRKWHHHYRLPLCPPGEESGNPLQYCCLENPMDRGAWRAPVRGVTESCPRLSEHISPMPCTNQLQATAHTVNIPTILPSTLFSLDHFTPDPWVFLTPSRKLVLPVAMLWLHLMSQVSA